MPTDPLTERERIEQALTDNVLEDAICTLSVSGWWKDSELKAMRRVLVDALAGRGSAPPEPPDDSEGPRTTVALPDAVSVKMLQNTVAALEWKLNACAPYLKDGETPAQCIERNRRDIDALLTLLAQEKQRVEELTRLAEQLTVDLTDAHNEILRVQGVTENLDAYDWPDWSGPANSIRWAERLLVKPLGRNARRQRGSAPPEGTPYGAEVLCGDCARVFCPHGERLHFHHDGCPACCETSKGAR